MLTPLRVQVLLAITSVLGALFVASRIGRAEHRRWLRQERLAAYSSFVATASAGLEAVYAMLVPSRQGKGNPEAIIRRAEQTTGDLQRPVSSIRLLGPTKVTRAAGTVRLLLGWSALEAIEAITELDNDDELTAKTSERHSCEVLSRRAPGLRQSRDLSSSYRRPHWPRSQVAAVRL